MITFRVSVGVQENKSMKGLHRFFAKSQALKFEKCIAKRNARFSKRCEENGHREEIQAAVWKLQHIALVNICQPAKWALASKDCQVIDMNRLIKAWSGKKRKGVQREGQSLFSRDDSQTILRNSS